MTTVSNECVVVNCVGDDSIYFNTLRRAWERGESFVNVEQDIDAPARVTGKMMTCPHDWCAAPYPYLDRPRQFGLGCVKFSAGLIARTPEMFDTIGTWHNAAHPPEHWCTLDSWIYQYLIARGETRCEDHELVGHFGHPGKRSSSHGCFSIWNPPQA